MTRLAVDRLGVRAGDRWLLRDVSFGVAAGECVGLVGPNGAGKTTLLRAISGFLAGDEGTITLDGREVRSIGTQDRARRIASVPQSATVDRALTVLDVVLQGRHPHLGRFAVESSADLAIASLALASAGAAPFADRLTATLSGGERQRVLVARALAQQPSLLLLDEPTANLDLRHQIEILGLVRRLAGDGLAVIAAIHDLSLAARFCDRLIVLANGSIVADGPPASILTAELIESVYGVRAVVTVGPLTGAPELAGVTTIGEPSAAPVIHVIAGGGRGSRVIGRLSEAGYRISTSVLGDGDTDLQAARLAGASTVVHPAFAPIDDVADAAHRALIAAAAMVVVADICWGAANLRNLTAVEDASLVVLIDGEPIADRDFTGGLATAIVKQLAGCAESAPIDQLISRLDVITRRTR